MNMNMKHKILLALPCGAAMVAHAQPDPGSALHSSGHATDVAVPLVFRQPHPVRLARLRWTEGVKVIKNTLRVLAVVVVSFAMGLLIDILGNGVTFEAVEHRPAMPTNCPAQNPLYAFDEHFHSEMKSSKQIHHRESAPLGTASTVF